MVSLYHVVQVLYLFSICILKTTAVNVNCDTKQVENLYVYPKQTQEYFFPRY